jgi:hypothetical protein
MGDSSTGWVQTGWIIGTADGSVVTSGNIYTEAQDTTYYPGNGISYHLYGAPGQTNEGYWTYYDGYSFQLNGNTFYEFAFDYGSKGNHAPYYAFMTWSQQYVDAVQEVYQGNANVGCELASATYGEDSSGNPSTIYQLVLETSSSVWGQWNSTVGTTLHGDIPYSWTEAANYYSAKSN